MPAVHNVTLGAACMHPPHLGEGQAGLEDQQAPGRLSGLAHPPGGPAWVDMLPRPPPARLFARRTRAVLDSVPRA